MKRLFQKSLISIACLLASLTLASDAVEPANVTFNCIRDEAVASASDASFYEGSTLRLTNCVIYNGTTTNAARQGLADVTIQVKVGNTTTSIAYSGTAQVETSGTFSATTIVPTNTGYCYIQLKITDVNTNSYIYPWKILNRKSPL